MVAVLPSNAYEEATSLEALLAATYKAAHGKRKTKHVARFLMDAERECLRLSKELRLPVGTQGSWLPSKATTYSILDPKPRIISVAPFADRVVHHALCAPLMPVFERFAIYHSYACRKGKGPAAALRTAQRFARVSSHAWKSDISAYFASIPRDRLVQLLSRRVSDHQLFLRLQQIVQHGGAQDRGLPIGSLVSQNLANLYLGQLDHYIQDGLGIRRYLRYMDDFVIFGEKERLSVFASKIGIFVSQKLGLSINPRSTHLLKVQDGIPLLGCRVYPQMLRLQKQKLGLLRRRHQALLEDLASGYIEEEEAAARATSRFAHIHHLLHRASGAGIDRTNKAGCAGRLLEQQREEAHCIQSQQERAIQPQQQPGFSPFEFSTQQEGRTSFFRFGTEGGGLRTLTLCPGADQVGIQRPPQAHPAEWTKSASPAAAPF